MNEHVSKYKESIMESARQTGIDSCRIARIIQAENSQMTLKENKSIWNKIKLFFKKLFKIKKEIKPCNTLGLGQFSINQVDKNNK